MFRCSNGAGPNRWPASAGSGDRSIQPGRRRHNRRCVSTPEHERPVGHTELRFRLSGPALHPGRRFRPSRLPDRRQLGVHTSAHAADDSRQRRTRRPRFASRRRATASDSHGDPHSGRSVRGDGRSDCPRVSTTVGAGGLHGPIDAWCRSVPANPGMNLTSRPALRGPLRSVRPRCRSCPNR